MRGWHNDLSKDFFEATAENLRGLNRTERDLFDYVVKNMGEVKHMSIQKFAAGKFLSTTTIFRFTKKLGFSGYSDFINSLLVTSHIHEDTASTLAVTGPGYSEDYLKNAIEAVRVMSKPRIEKVIDLLSLDPNIYILTDDNTHAIGQYCERLFIGLGFHAYFPETAYQMHNLVNRIRGGDMILALSYSGDDAVMIDFIERVLLRERPHLLSITRADNNTLESLSDTNFYVFADELQIGGMCLRSSVTMLMIVELLVYEFISRKEQLSETQ